jgi:hypothetical protein
VKCGHGAPQVRRIYEHIDLNGRIKVGIIECPKFSAGIDAEVQIGMLCPCDGDPALRKVDARHTGTPVLHANVETKEAAVMIPSNGLDPTMSNPRSTRTNLERRYSRRSSAPIRQCILYSSSQPQRLCSPAASARVLWLAE